LLAWRNVSEKQAKDLIKKKRKGAGVNVLEEEEQKKLAQYLDYKYMEGDWCHVPNEGDHKVQYYVKQKTLGVKSGVPDALIFKPVAGYNGIAIELKRLKGGRVSESQKRWLKRFKENGWAVKLAEGADAAIEFIEELEG